MDLGETILSCLAIFAIVNGILLNYLQHKTSYLKNHIRHAYYEKKNMKYNWVSTFLSSFFLSPLALIVTIGEIYDIFGGHRKRLDKVHECDSCGHFFRLNQVDYIKATHEIIRRNIFGSDFFYNKNKDEKIFDEKSNYTICPNCNNFSKDAKYHEDLDDQNVKFTEKTTFSMNYEIYKDKKISYKRLYEHLKISEKKLLEEIKLKLKQDAELIKNENNYKENKTNMEIKRKLDQVNKLQIKTKK